MVKPLNYISNRIKEYIEVEKPNTSQSLLGKKHCPRWWKKDEH